MRRFSVSARREKRRTFFAGFERGDISYRGYGQFASAKHFVNSYAAQFFKVAIVSLRLLFIAEPFRKGFIGLSWAPIFLKKSPVQLA